MHLHRNALYLSWLLCRHCRENPWQMQKTASSPAPLPLLTGTALCAHVKKRCVHMQCTTSTSRACGKYKHPRSRSTNRHRHRRESDAKKQKQKEKKTVAKIVNCGKCNNNNRMGKRIEIVCESVNEQIANDSEWRNGETKLL